MSDRRVIVVTGARKGLGRALAEHLLADGWAVAGISRGSSDLSDVNYAGFEADVADEAAMVRTFAAVAKRFGRIDALVNNAGVAAMNHALLTTADGARRVFETNTIGTFIASREAAKHMRRQRAGRIVNLSTVAVPLAVAGEAVYAASKAAVESLTRVLAREFAPLGVTCNAVGPTPVDTDLIRGVGREKIKALLAQQALQRMGEVRDVVNAVEFFLRPESDFVTGQVIYLGGVW